VQVFGIKYELIYLLHTKNVTVICDDMKIPPWQPANSHALGKN